MPCKLNSDKENIIPESKGQTRCEVGRKVMDLPSWCVRVGRPPDSRFLLGVFLKAKGRATLGWQAG